MLDVIEAKKGTKWTSMNRVREQERDKGKVFQGLMDCGEDLTWC
jgi:hypothetical protein